MKATSKRICFQLILSLLLASIAVSCGTSHRLASDNTFKGMEEKLIDYGKKYLGKPYRYAGRGPYAFDCSGFTSFVFEAFGYTLGSSSVAQGKQFPTIAKKSDLKKGDLVFFEGRARNGVVGHVGIVTEVRSNGIFRFIHASTSYGVIISSSNEPYYAARYLHGGRVLKESRIEAEVTQQEKEGKRIPTLPIHTDTRNGSLNKEMNRPNANGQNPETVSRSVSNPLKELLLTVDPPHSADRKRDKERRKANETNNRAVWREENTTLPDPVEAEKG